MQGFSTVDGFFETTESLAELIKYVANESSVGLFYVQQHTQNSVPIVFNLKNHIMKKLKEKALHIEDMEDSISMLKSMKETGTPIGDEMIKDVRRSLELMSTKLPRGGLIHKPTSGLQIERTSSWGPATCGQSQVYATQDRQRMLRPLSRMFNPAKERHCNFTLPHLESTALMDIQNEKPTNHPIPLQLEAPVSSLSQRDVESDELPLSSPTADEKDLTSSM